MRRLPFVLMIGACLGALVWGCAPGGAAGDGSAAGQHAAQSRQGNDPQAGQRSPGATQGGQVGSAPGAASTPKADETAAATTITATVKDGQVRPPTRRVDVALGERVRVKVMSDQSDHVHIHGYDLEAHVAPDEPAVVTFTADVPGVFEVETHESGLVLFQLSVR